MLFSGDSDSTTSGAGDDARITLPLLPLRDIVVFPGYVTPLYVGRSKSIAAVEQSMHTDGKQIFLAAQKDAKTKSPTPDKIHSVGTVSNIIQTVRLHDGTIKVLVEGKYRARIVRHVDSDEAMVVELEPLVEEYKPSVEMSGHMRALVKTFEKYVKYSKKVPPEQFSSIKAISNPNELANTVAEILELKLEDKQRVLEITDPFERITEVLKYLHGEIEILQVDRRVRGRVKKQMEQSQREWYLNEQMRAIQKELGHRDEFKNELQEIEEKLEKAGLTEEAEQKARREMQKLRMMAPMSAEATVVRNYLDWMVSIPWKTATEDNLDIAEASRILDEDHYGLEKPKERILEYLAVLKLVKQLKGPILCLVGPPGVGKTSLGKSIARAVGRNFVRISLGGVRDEAEIRGHRRTYIGALPGKILQVMKKAGSINPVLLLDEVDKMGSDFRGDPASALLEVLDPEQNNVFNDHYLDCDYDLSKVMFITTANSLSGIPLPLMDRMEIIQLEGYTEYDKLEIAKNFLLPKQRENHGLTEEQLTISDDAIRRTVREYTKEAGVRSLEREVSRMCRKTARQVVENEDLEIIEVTAGTLEDTLGVPRFRQWRKREPERIGLANGLAWTQFGGDLLDIEVSTVTGTGKVTITGKLGDVMEESARAAISYVRSRADDFELEKDFYQKTDVHVHVPEGATPKDGPSAGITIATAITSALSGTPVRSDVAMTGEITLRGRVLPIGGLREKLLAAQRAGIKLVLIPSENEKDLDEVPDRIKEGLEIQRVGHMDEVLRYALLLDDPEAFYRRIHREEKDPPEEFDRTAVPEGEGAPTIN